MTAHDVRRLLRAVEARQNLLVLRPWLHTAELEALRDWHRAVASVLSRLCGGR